MVISKDLFLGMPDIGLQGGYSRAQGEEINDAYRRESSLVVGEAEVTIEYD